VFVLVRGQDPSGVSGTGVVAEGVVWWDGSASMFWRGEERSVTYFCGGVSAIEAIHGHGGSTWVHYLADPGDIRGVEALGGWGPDPGAPARGWVRCRAPRVWAGVRARALVWGLGALRVLREGCRRAR
jgi:hypothetical protein